MDNVTEVIKVWIDKENNDYTYKIRKQNHCCNMLKQSKIIDLYNEYMTSPCDVCSKLDSIESDQEAYDICEECGLQGYEQRLSYAIVETDTYPEPWEDYYTTDIYYHPIDYCPFCGSELKINVVEEIDVSEEYSYVSEKMHELSRKANRTDSKKKTSELRHMSNKISDIVNRMYRVSSESDIEELKDMYNSLMEEGNSENNK